MKYLPYILKHLRKTWIRTISTIVAMALCIFLISVLQTALKAFYGGLETASTERLITRHRVSLAENLPVAYQPRIEAIPGIKRVAKFNWFGGTVGVPRALRARESTTMILVKLVQSSRSAGATPSTVVRTMIWTTRLGSPGMLTVTLASSTLGAEGSEVFVGALGAAHSTGCAASACAVAI